MKRMQLSIDAIIKILETFDPNIDLVVTWARGEITRSENVPLAQLRALITSAIEEGHQPGGDFELFVPSLGKVLVGHHDGIYWLEDPKPV